MICRRPDRQNRPSAAAATGRRIAWSFAILAAAASVTAAEPPPGATSCSGCHPPKPMPGTSVPPLVGRNPDDIVAAIAAFRSGQRPATVMDRIAKGFSQSEIRLIADWYGALRE
jgi:cytochrome c553